MSKPSFYAGRDNKGAFATGTRAKAEATISEVIPPDPNIDILAEIAALKNVFASMSAIDPKAIRRLEEALEEAQKATPKREEVKGLVAQATRYAKEAAGFTEAAEKLKPHLQQVAGWVGAAWATWAPSFGLG